MSDTATDKGILDDLIAPCMFVLSLLFLAIVSSIMVLWIDVPRVVEVAVADSTGGDVTMPELDDIQPFAQLSEEELAYELSAYRLGQYCGILLLLLWPVFIAEQVFNLVRLDDRDSFWEKHPYWWTFCLIPPLRLCAHRRGEVEQVWLPVLGWQNADRRLERRLERTFSIPMIGIALLILPVLGLQFYFGHRIADHPALRFFLHFGTGLIWFAFAVEFIAMVSVADKKLAYCKKHWLDLAIILLPLISFLRTLRLLRASKLVKIGKIQQLGRVVRVYRLRAVTMRALRAMMVLEVLNRLLRVTPESRIRKLESRYAEKQAELEELAEEIAELKARFRKESTNASPRVFSNAADPAETADAAPGNMPIATEPKEAREASRTAIDSPKSE